LGTITTDFLTYATSINHNSFIRFSSIDLKNVKQLKYRVRAQSGGLIEVYLGNKNGPLVSSVKVPAKSTGTQAEWKEVVTDMKESREIQDLYFVFKDETGKKNLFDIDWIYFASTTL
jgi:hypothetical protein